MNRKRWVLASLAVTVAVNGMEAIFHPVFLSKEYAATASLWRAPEAIATMMPWGWVAGLVTAFLLVYIYHRGYEGKGSRVMEGLRFGLIVGLFVSIPMAVWTYIFIPMTPMIAAGWFVISMLDYLVAGMIIALIYRRNA